MSSSNTTEMDLAFGAGEWAAGTFEGVDPASVFNEETCFIYIDGSDNGALALAAFLGTNLTLMEDWVEASGRLLLNSAPNEGGDIPFGFGGSTLVNGAYMIRIASPTGQQTVKVIKA